MNPTPREKLCTRLTRSHGADPIKLIANRLQREGLDWLTDDQVADLVGDNLRDWRFVNEMNRNNRRIKDAA